MIQLNRITIAVTDMDQMVKFYNAAFAADIQPLEVVGGFQFYGGSLAGIELVMCPNELASVDAKQNRQQFRFAVEDMDQVLAAVKSSGGQLLGDQIVTGSSKTAGVRDPDGNTIELIEYL